MHPSTQLRNSVWGTAPLRPDHGHMSLSLQPTVPSCLLPSLVQVQISFSSDVYRTLLPALPPRHHLLVRGCPRPLDQSGAGQPERDAVL